MTQALAVYLSAMTFCGAVFIVRTIMFFIRKERGYTTYWDYMTDYTDNPFFALANVVFFVANVVGAFMLLFAFFMIILRGEIC